VKTLQRSFLKWWQITCANHFLLIMIVLLSTHMSVYLSIYLSCIIYVCCFAGHTASLIWLTTATLAWFLTEQCSQQVESNASLATVHIRMQWEVPGNACRQGHYWSWCKSMEKCIGKAQTQRTTLSTKGYVWLVINTHMIKKDTHLWFLSLSQPHLQLVTEFYCPFLTW
jgi:hypothetical protein